VPVAAVVVDFDGTASDEDVSYRLFERFGRPGWRELDAEFEREAIGSRECLLSQAALLDADPDELLAFVAERFGLAPTFPAFVTWARERRIAVSIASDGLGFHLAPMLRAGGVDHVRVYTNLLSFDSGVPAFSFPHEHPRCRTCGTCKMGVVLRERARGPVAFVGDGFSDRLGALYADVVFAKGHLAAYCDERGVPFVPWTTFDDVRRELESGRRLPGPAETEDTRCPGWSVAVNV
jgi:2,3-diketo-5-methylthio-1-phosphopentane phosphatase